MKLIINLSGNYAGGGLQVALSFLNECKKVPNNQYYIFLGPSFLSLVDKTTFPNNFIFHDIPKCKLWNLDRLLSPLEKGIQPDVVFSVFGPRYWRSKAPHLMGYALPHYIYKESPYFKKINWKENIILKAKEKIHLFFLNRDADALVCETGDVKDRVSKLFPSKKVYTVSNTYGTQFLEFISTSQINSVILSKDESKFRLILLSKYYVHKNIELIKSVWDGLKKRGENQIQFVLTITNEEYNSIFGNLYVDNIITVGTISVLDCPALYNVCDAAFLPTLLECYSANYPEAMIMKKPILTSDLGFARTVCHEAALYFDPTNVDDIVEKIITLKNNHDLQECLIEKGIERVKDFPTASQRAEQYLTICESLMK